MENPIGKGVIRLKSAGSGDSRTLGIEIRPEAITFRALDRASGSMSLFEAAGSLGTDVQANGALVFATWPAAPHAEFAIVGLSVETLTQASEAFSVHVTGTGDFGASMHGHFSALDMRLRHVTGQPVTAESGSKATWQLFDTEVALAPSVDDARGLTFVVGTPGVVAIDDIGQLHVTGTVSAQAFDRWNGVLACYAFDEAADGNIHDYSGTGTPLTLITQPIPGADHPGRGKRGARDAGSQPQWVTGGIALDGSYYLASQQGAGEALAAIQRTGAFSVELWLVAPNRSQDGPAQILALHAQNHKNWFTLAQGASGSNNNYLSIDIQFEHPPTEWQAPFASPSGSLPENLAHVVYTRDASGRERIYVNSQVVAERMLSGNLSRWPEDLQLIIGSDKKNDPDTDQWHGEIRHLAIYNKALSADEVLRHEVPVFALDNASFELDKVPAPLSGVKIPGTVSFDIARTTVDVHDEVALDIRPNLGFTSLRVVRSRAGDAPWSFAGTFGARIWHGSADLEASLAPGSGLLTLTSPAGQEASFDIPGLGAIAFGDIALSATAPQGGAGASAADLGWSLSSGRYLAFTAVPAWLPSQVAVDRDLELLRPNLGLDQTDVLLQGQWLGQPLVLHTRVSDGHYRFVGSTRFSLPFALDLPAPIHQHSGVQIGADVHLDNATMNVALDIELGERGFFATLDRDFDYTGPGGAAHNLKLARRRLYRAPNVQHLLLQDITDEVATRIAGLFADNRRKIEVNALDPAIPLALLGATAENTIPARFLGEDMTLNARVEGANWTFDGQFGFAIPFSLDLPALIDENTGARLTDAIAIADQPMNISMRIRLSQAGFLAVLDSHFKYTDKSGTQQAITLPERRLYQAPRSKNELLGDIVRVVEKSATSLFQHQGRNVADYYLTLGDTQPRILLSTTGSPAETMSTTLPGLFAADIQLSSASGIFQLEQSGATCTLSLSLAGKAGAALRADYDDFLAKIANASPLSAGAVRMLTRRIAERLPADYDDLLYYYHGWDVSRGHIDLEGGMRLRIEMQNYQFVQASDPSAKRGFVGSGTVYLAVNSYTHAQSDGSRAQLLGFGPFLSRLQGSGATDITFEGAGGVLDLVKDGNRRAMYRMFFPAQASTGLGPERVVTIIGTDTLAEMRAATADFDPAGNRMPAVGSSFFFRGKAFIVPEIQVFVRNQPVYVPVGTTLRQLLEADDHVPAAALPGQDLRAFAGRSRPLRLVHEGADSKATYRFINLTTGGAVNGMDVLDLPLVKGDRFDF